jgi:hypothetical protein
MNIYDSLTTTYGRICEGRAFIEEFDPISSTIKKTELEGTQSAEETIKRVLHRRFPKDNYQIIRGKAPVITIDPSTNAVYRIENGNAQKIFEEITLDPSEKERSYLRIAHLIKNIKEYQSQQAPTSTVVLPDTVREKMPFKTTII